MYTWNERLRVGEEVETVWVGQVPQTRACWEALCIQNYGHNSNTVTRDLLS